MNNFANDEQLFLLALIRLDGVGPVTFYKLLDKYKTPQKAFNAHCLLKDISAESALEQAKREYFRTLEFGANFLFFNDKNYPDNLKSVKSPPPVLIYKGDLKAFNNRALAMVGTRNASAAGIINAKNIASGLGELGFVVVSGLARGIDYQSHRAAITGGTVAVIAGGIDNIYPPEHAELQAAICTTENCCLITEKPIGYRPTARDFHGRNRIISALSEAVIVIEAAKKSGSIITAGFAEKHDRPVLAVPGSPLDKRYSGTNYLIKNGAALIEDAYDVSDGLKAGKISLKEDMPEYIADKDTQNLEAKEQIYSLLGYSPIMVEQLSEVSGLQAADILAKITELELEGKIKKDTGGAIVLIA